MSRAFEFAIVTPAGFPDASLVAAASRAGAWGILDLEWVSDKEQGLTAVRRLGRYQGISFGVKVDGYAVEFLEQLAQETPETLAAVILTGGEADAIAPCVATLRRRRVRIIVSVSCIEEMVFAERLGVDAVIVKGHEAGGWVGEETAFVLLQRLLSCGTIPVWVHGGIGLHTVAACYAAGASGVVLDSQAMLLRESTLPDGVRAVIARMDGSETVCLGGEIGAACRMYSRPRLAVLEELREFEGALENDARPHNEVMMAWREAVRTRVGWESPDRHVWLLGQDAAFAPLFARRFRTVAGMLHGLRESIESHCRLARQLHPLDAHGSLARSHGTRYPIVQGPMTRVSDTPAFAERVAADGGLPFLALALLRGEEVRSLLEQTLHRLGDRPWGVGILGFVPLELRQEQLEVVRAIRPPFALIAGGRPDQALSLEQSGIPTYLHVPSPGLLTMFLDSGARRFVFEGRECGGHVGPRSSFVLWELMINVLLEKIPPGPEAEQFSVLFAGGIHDALSSAMVATLAAPLAERGIRVGVLLGTAYLFTKEAVESGAIVASFQDEALRCERTVLLETGPGHATRCVATAFGETFKWEKRRLRAEQCLSPDEIRRALEDLNLGRLRIASKGITRNPQCEIDPNAPRLVHLDEATQRAEGMYMIGQVAALRKQTCTVAELHHNVSVLGSQRLAQIEIEPARSVQPGEVRPVDVAIVGMACLLPKAPTLKHYWENILNKVDAISEVPPERWDWRRYYDPDPHTPDKVYSKWGGFIDAVPFDPVRYGMPPNTLSSVEPLQLLTLEVARAALTDAGYADRPFPRERTGIILGVGGGSGDLGQQYAVRSTLPLYIEETPEGILRQLPEWTEDSFAGILLNVVAGRVANRFDLGGVNYTVDAACASSLAAVYAAVRELEAGTADMMLVGGADTVQNPFAYLCFSKTHALSPRGRCRPFDAGADGIVISEGVAMLVLKRLADAERDGDRVYAVIKAVAGASDGRDRGLTAPRPEGQIRALERAYAAAGFGPDTVSLIEAHGTGTVAGDQAEVESLTRVFTAHGSPLQSCALGSVKSMIGHTKCTAGVAGLIKVALALHHRILPPTLHVERPNKAFATENPFYVNTEARPWLPGRPGAPRRAGVSSFGFGGTNFHAVLEEYPFAEPPAVASQWTSELFLWSGTSRQDITAGLERVERGLAAGATPALHDLAYSVWMKNKEQAKASRVTLAIVASTLDDLCQKLNSARESLNHPDTSSLSDPRGIYFTETPLSRAGQVAFLFPGQGSQYVDMLRDLAVHFSEIRDVFTDADVVLAGRFPQPLSRYVFPPPRFSADEERGRQEALTQTNIAQPALGAAGLGLLALFRSFGVVPQVVAGHSYGEYVALCAAGVCDKETLFTLSEARGRAILETAGDDLGTMAAVQADQERTATVLAALDGVWISNVNAPTQTMISGTHRGIAEAVRRLDAGGVRARPIPVACGFHSPLVAPARENFAARLATTRIHSPRLTVFSNTLATPYPQDPQEIIHLLQDHLVKPVRFAEQIEAMYRAGVRIFVEAGPGNVLTNLVRQNLGDRAHLAVAPGVAGRPGLLSLQLALAQLAAHGIAVNLDRLFAGREVRALNLDALVEETREAPLPMTTWLVHGGRAWPAREAKAKSPIPVSLSSVHTGADRQENPSPPVQDHASVAIDGESHSSQPATPQSGNGQLLVPGVARADTAVVMAQFQRLMDKFLETQRNVMLAYLQTAQVPAASIPSTAKREGIPPSRAESLPAVSDPPVTNGSVGQNGTGIHGRKGEERNGVPTPANEGAARTGKEEAQGEGRGSTQTTGTVTTRLNREGVTQALLQIVSERTGYPPDMLGLDLNIEADLGIDSIKRVEIFGAFQQMHLSSSGTAQELMEKLAGMKTLRGIVDAVCEILGTLPQEVGANGPAQPSSRPAARAETTHTEPVAVPVQDVSVPRFVLTAVETPLSGDSDRLPLLNRPVIVTDDQRGVAHAVAAGLRTRGVPALLVRQGARTERVASDLFTVNLTDAAAVEEFCRTLRHERGPLGGVIHLLPLRDRSGCGSDTFLQWRECLAPDVKSLFSLVKCFGAEAEAAKDSHAGCVVAVSAMGGHFASSRVPEEFFPTDGGLAGMVKTLALEWPRVRCRVIDVEVDVDAVAVANYIFQELCTAERDVEVGYRDGHRFVLQAAPAPLQGTDVVTVNARDVILITGGARGITAEVACEIATRYRPTIVVVGRSAFPDADEPEGTAGLIGRGLKSALIRQLSRGGQRPSPAQVEAAYARILREREVRRNITAIREAGATVHYYQVDVRDRAAFGNLIDDLYQSYGRIDGVIHGAGVIEDKLLADKTLDSFERVFDTKVESAFLLGQKLRPESLKFLVFFSSVAGRFGNRGQGDYAAANEVLNKLAVYLDHKWPARVVAVNWGPWGKTGMVSDEVERQFLARGVQVIPPVAGRRGCDEEIRLGRKGEGEIILGGGPWETVSVMPVAPADPALPLLREGISSVVDRSGALEVLYRLDPSHDLYLRDHRLDGRPVFPAAMAMELMAEVAQRGWPEWQVVGVHSLQVLRGIVLEDGGKTVRVIARPRVQALTGGKVEVEVKILGVDEPAPTYYRAAVQLADRLTRSSFDRVPLPGGLQPFPLSTADAYDRWLFHGPLFQGVSQIEGVSSRALVALVKPSSPRYCLSPAASGHWLIDPVMIDSGFQLAILWARAYTDMTPLPAKLGAYRRFTAPRGALLRCHLQAESHAGGAMLTTHLFFSELDGHPVSMIENMEFSCSKALNRLGGSAPYVSAEAHCE